MNTAANFVATLISAPTSALDSAVLARAASVLPSPGEPVWLDPGIAADIPFSGRIGNDNRLVGEHVRAALEGSSIDVVVQAAEGRRKHLFLADMDSTMIGQECIDEMADFVGKKKEVSAVTEQAMRGEIAFAPALRARVALLKGLPDTIADEVIASRITLTPGAKTALATMRKHGAYTCLVSGGFTLFTHRIAKTIGFDEERSNILGVANGKLTGEVIEPVFGRDAKRATLIELRNKLKLQNTDTMAAGDGANDLDMIMEAGLGVAYRAKPAVAAAAPARIEHGDLTALLYMQGYRRDEFAA
jgi:phosphoserine phosphatase